MTNNTIFIAVALIAIGIYGFVNGTKESQKKAEEKTAELRKENPDAPAVEPDNVKTALIPSFFGVALLVCAIVVIFKENLRKHVMHLAAMIGLFGLVGGFMPVYRQTMVKNLPLDISAPAVRTGLIMSVICAIFVGLCVKSFIDARKARQAQAPAA